MIRLKTQTESLSRQECIRIASMALRWCQRNMGMNNRKQYMLSCYIRKAPHIDYGCGEYVADGNDITIFYNNCEDVKELIETCIHEWTHYLQPIRTKYFKYKGPYSKHPFEIEAHKNERKHLKECWGHINAQINKKKKN